MAIEKKESAWVKQEKLLKKNSEDDIDSSKQLLLAENKSSEFNLEF